MTREDKGVSILLHPHLYEVVEKLAYIYDQSIEQYIYYAIEQQVNGDIANHPDEIGNKACAKLKSVLEAEQE